MTREEGLSPEDRLALAELADRAYERRVGEVLEEVAGAFEDWRSGRLAASEVAGLLHDLDHDALRRLADERARLAPDLYVSLAVAQGVISREELTPGLRRALRRRIEALEDMEGA